MIEITMLNDKEIILNAEHIEKIEVVPDTIITLLNGKKYLTKQSKEEVLERIYMYKRKIFTLDK